MQKFIPNFQQEVLPYIYSIHLNFISKKTKKVISTPTGASTKVRNFFREKGIRASQLESVSVPPLAYWTGVHIYRSTDSYPLFKDNSVITNAYSNKTKCIRLPWGYFQRGATQVPSLEQTNRLNYIISGECNRDLKILCANENWEVECFLVAEVYYTPDRNEYGYFGDSYAKVLVILGATNNQFSKFATPTNIVIEKIIL